MYAARVIPSSFIYDVLEVKIRTVYEKCFVGVDKRTKQAYVYNINDIGKRVFLTRDEALLTVKKAEEEKGETVYE